MNDDKNMRELYMINTAANLVMPPELFIKKEGIYKCELRPIQEYARVLDEALRKASYSIKKRNV